MTFKSLGNSLPISFKWWPVKVRRSSVTKCGNFGCPIKASTLYQLLCNNLAISCLLLKGFSCVVCRGSERNLLDFESAHKRIRFWVSHVFMMFRKCEFSLFRILSQQCRDYRKQMRKQECFYLHFSLQSFPCFDIMQIFLVGDLIDSDTDFPKHHHTCWSFTSIFTQLASDSLSTFQVHYWRAIKEPAGRIAGCHWSAQHNKRDHPIGKYDPPPNNNAIT